MKDDQEKREAKAKLLAGDGVLNPHPDRLRDPKFHEQEFFDPLDLVQVKYEMLRRVSVDCVSITDVAFEYGVSRPTFYQARTSLEEAGLSGLVPRKRGPRGPRKLKNEMIAFLEQQTLPGQPMRARELASLLHERFGVEVHPRTIERALREKKTPRNT